MDGVPGDHGLLGLDRGVTEGEAFHKLPIPLTLDYDPWTAGLLANGGTYEFKLQTMKGNDLGVYSNVATARPSVPTPGGARLPVTSGKGQATVSWTAGSHASG